MRLLRDQREETLMAKSNNRVDEGYEFQRKITQVFLDVAANTGGHVIKNKGRVITEPSEVEPGADGTADLTIVSVGGNPSGARLRSRNLIKKVHQKLIDSGLAEEE
jgi:hypothetical protein